MNGFDWGDDPALILGFLLSSSALYMWWLARTSAVGYRMTIGAVGYLYSMNWARKLNAFLLPAGLSLLSYMTAFLLMRLFPWVNPKGGGWLQLVITGLLLTGTTLIFLGCGTALTARPRWLLSPQIRDVPSSGRGRGRHAGVQSTAPSSPKPTLRPVHRKRIDARDGEIRLTRVDVGCYSLIGSFKVVFDVLDVSHLKRNQSLSIPSPVGREVTVQVFNGIVPSNTWRGTLEPGDRVELIVSHAAPQEVFDAIGTDCLSWVRSGVLGSRGSWVVDLW